MVYYHNIITLNVPLDKNARGCVLKIHEFIIHGVKKVFDHNGQIKRTAPEKVEGPCRAMGVSISSCQQADSIERVMLAVHHINCSHSQ